MRHSRRLVERPAGQRRTLIAWGKTGSYGIISCSLFGVSNEQRKISTSLFSDSITLSATPGINLIPQMPFSARAEVLLPCTEAAGVADAMIEAHFVARRVRLKPCCFAQPRMVGAICQGRGRQLRVGSMSFARAIVQ